MGDLDLQSLVDKLNPVCRKGLEHAAEFCVSQTNYNVEIEHFLFRLLEMTDTDIFNLFQLYELSVADIREDLFQAVERFRRGNTRTPALSPHILRLIEKAWLISSLHFNSTLIRSGMILQALFDDDLLRGVLFESTKSIRKLSRASFRKDLSEIIRSSETESSGDMHGKKKNGDQESGNPEARESKTPNLDQYTIDLTERARKGKIDPIRGRDMEIRQLIDILTRRRQNNPILTGEAGVGKTAVVEGFAIRIAAGDVPPSLRKISLRLLDLGLLQAGAGVKGEFEKRLKSVIDEVKKSETPIIVFIDEAHTMIGAGGTAGMGDAANLLKPALARGELRTIAATTWAEYKKYFEKDPALARRFQVVKVEEPDEDSAVEMLRGIVSHLEKHHHIMVLDEAVKDAVRLSSRYISGRRLPDKAISVLDTACARVAVGQSAVPPPVEDLSRRMEQLNLEIGILDREESVGKDHKNIIAELREQLEKTAREYDTVREKWKKESDIVNKILHYREKLLPEKGKPKKSVLVKKKIMERETELKALQGDSPLVPLYVDSNTVANVISNWTGIPVGKMMTDEISTVLNLKEQLEERIIGQSQSLDTVCRRIHTYRANLDDPQKPVGVFLLVGTSGIGKTETAIALSDILYGGDRSLITVNMSEYQEAYSVSGLKGSPPGYVGYGQGGVLTEAVRRKPYSVVLLDEVEKAHPDVTELFYQVFDKGIMEDSEGLVVDFKNTVIILTSNVGSDTIMDICVRKKKRPDIDSLTELIWPELLRRFKPAFLGRLTVIPYYPLNQEVIRRIVELKVKRIQERFLANHKIDLTWSDALIDEIAGECVESDTGARNVDQILTQIILPDISSELLRRMAAGMECTGIHLYFDPERGPAYRYEPSEEKIAETRVSQAVEKKNSGWLDFFFKKNMEIKRDSIPEAVDADPADSGGFQFGGQGGEEHSKPAEKDDIPFRFRANGNGSPDPGTSVKKPRWWRDYLKKK